MNVNNLAKPKLKYNVEPNYYKQNELDNKSVCLLNEIMRLFSSNQLILNMVITLCKRFNQEILDSQQKELNCIK